MSRTAEAGWHRLTGKAAEDISAVSQTAVEAWDKRCYLRRAPIGWNRTRQWWQSCWNYTHAGPDECSISAGFVKATAAVLPPACPIPCTLFLA
jgi:hypothetical protein